MPQRPHGPELPDDIKRLLKKSVKTADKIGEARDHLLDLARRAAADESLLPELKDVAARYEKLLAFS